MLQTDQMEFNHPVAMGDDIRLCTLTFEVAESLKTGIQYALNNFEMISKLEYEFNDGQPAKVTFKQLEWAKVFIENSKHELQLEVRDTAILNGQHYVPIGEFLLNCHILSQRNATKFKILTDDKRKVLIFNLFGTEYTEEITTSISEVKSKEAGVSCSQVIFDTADISSAIDELIMNQIDRTVAPWRIRSVYIQESIRNEIENILTPERLNATSKVIKAKHSEDCQRKNEELAKKFGGKLVRSDNRAVYFLFDVPPKYVPQSTETSFVHIPVAVNFFRTVKEAIQLIKTDCDPTKKNLTSVWTGNIQLFYELAADLNSEIVWSNCLGVFDAVIPSLLDELDSKKVNRSAQKILCGNFILK